ncbi:MAG: ribonuclease PH [Candidatus Cloacimonadales bacterium]|jgi:ribonuclease PH|nr:ribonuclease PH [Candidatus Cloacimonadota bacterium]MDD2649870.1 ribonuclease PH [Candidatus Cloacimonadota bacterium]MDD3500996.1 ribonuclease PH [Candidatus Cloacimonadota bacterium]MDX9977958.1 ribonuclease PH [Candidatus Cloacimonadales bacterium]
MFVKRDTKITYDFVEYPYGSVLIETGKTKVLCNVSIEESIPPFLRDKEQGWLTAEYSMLPASTHSRTRREVNSGKIGGRTAEIQRLIGRSLRAVVDLNKMPGLTAYIDCDVIQADGGTRTAAITGSAVALAMAFARLRAESRLDENPMKELVAAISVGIVDGKIISDLCYEEDSNAEVDFNIVMTESGEFVELQGTAEHNPFSLDKLHQILSIATDDIKELFKIQNETINTWFETEK